MFSILNKIRTAITPSSRSVSAPNNKITENWETDKNELNFHADLIRVVGMFLVILLHSAVEPHPIVTQPDQAEVIRWWTVTIYDVISQPGVPLFVLVSGALLLQPSKIEPVKVFLKKRLNRIVLPLLFWSIIYFMYRYFVLNEALTLTSIVHGFETGAYYHFWFMYMIFGIYLITPDDTGANRPFKQRPHQVFTGSLVHRHSNNPPDWIV